MARCPSGPPVAGLRALGFAAAARLRRARAVASKLRHGASRLRRVASERALCLGRRRGQPLRPALRPASAGSKSARGLSARPVAADRHVKWVAAKVQVITSYKDVTRDLDDNLSMMTCDDCDEQLPTSLVLKISKRPPVLRCILCHCNKLASAAGYKPVLGWRLRGQQNDVEFLHEDGRQQLGPFEGCPLGVSLRVEQFRAQRSLEQPCAPAKEELKLQPSPVQAASAQPPSGQDLPTKALAGGWLSRLRLAACHSF